MFVQTISDNPLPITLKCNKSFTTICLSAAPLPSSQTTTTAVNSLAVENYGYIRKTSIMCETNEYKLVHATMTGTSNEKHYYTGKF